MVSKTRYEIIQDYTPLNRSYLPLIPQGGVLHDTENFNNDSDEAEVSYFKKNKVGANAHAFIDRDSIRNTVPWHEQAWGSGPSSNKRYWQIEMCYTTDPVDFNEIWKRTVWLYAYLFAYEADKPMLKVTTGNMFSHDEISSKYHETDHTDPISYLSKFGVTMQQFRDAVKKCIDTDTIDDLNIKEMIVVLHKNDTGSTVTALQTDLNTLGYKGEDGITLLTDGQFGANTEFAVKAFQKAKGLTPDGMVGPMTQDAIKKALKTASTPVVSPPTPPPAPVIDYKAKFDTLVADLKTLIQKHSN